MTAIYDLNSMDQVVMGRECLSTGDDDLAADFFRIAYRTEIAQRVADIDPDAGPRFQSVQPWSLSDMWAAWASLSLYHRANREGVRTVKFYSDLVPESAQCSTQGCFWVDYLDSERVSMRLLMPDVFMHLHSTLARASVVRTLLPDLIESLRRSGQYGEAMRHEAELDSFLAIARSQ